MTCFDTNEVILSGAPFLVGSKDVLMQFENCRDYGSELEGIECASDDEILSQVNKISLILNLAEKQIDLYDMQDPIKTIY